MQSSDKNASSNAAYHELSQRLLECKSGDEPNILTDHQDLITPQLVEAMLLDAEARTQQDRRHEASALREIANQIQTSLRQGQGQAISISPIRIKRQYEFLGLLVQTTFRQKFDAKETIPTVEAVLQEHLPLLGEDFISVLEQSFRIRCTQVDQDKLPYLASTFAMVGDRLCEWTLGKAETNLLIAIRAYRCSLEILTEEEHASDWGIITRSMGNAYRELARHSAKPADAINTAIALYHDGLRVISPSEHAERWAGTYNNLGNAHHALAPYVDNPQQEIRKAIAAYKRCLLFFTKEKHRQRWAMVLNNLGVAYGGLAAHSRLPRKRLEQAIQAYSKALQGRTQADQPQEWADTQLNLGSAQLSLAPLSDKPELAIRQAIAHFEQVLRVRKRDQQATQWASAFHNLGTAYHDLAVLSEVPRHRIKQAIKIFEAALRIRTEENARQDWANTTNSLGNAYRRLAAFSARPKKELQQAITLFKNAQRVYRKEEFGSEWAMTNNNLGTAFEALAPFSEAPQQELLQAVAAYKNAREVYQRDNRPLDWLRVTNNLGCVHLGMASYSANPREELIKATEEFESALQMQTAKRHQQEWEKILNNLGNTYKSLAHHSQDPPQELKRSVEAYQACLQTRTEADKPVDWALTQNNLGGTLLSLSSWSENPRKEVEQALAAFDCALRVQKQATHRLEWGRTMHNIGNARRTLAQISGRPEQELEQAIKAYRHSLQVKSEAEQPEAWASTQMYLGDASWDLARYSKTPDQQIDLATGYYRKALKVLRPHTRAAGCLEAATRLGNLGFSFGRPDIAIEGYTLAIRAVESQRASDIDPARKEAILAKSIEVYANLVQVYVDQGQFSQAVEVVDRSKARNLVDLLSTKDLYPKGNIPTSVIERLDSLRSAIARAERELNRPEPLQTSTSDRLERPGSAGGNRVVQNSISHSTSAAAAEGQRREAQQSQEHQHQLREKRLLQLKQELQQLMQDQILTVDPTFSLNQVKPLSFAELQASLPDAQTALVSWYVAGSQLLAFVITRDQPQPICHRYPQSRLNSLLETYESYLQAYLDPSSQPNWIDALPQMLEQISRLLELESLTDQLAERAPGIDQLILVPHRFLHLLPLHALPLGAAGHSLLDHYARGVRFAPSMQVLQVVQQRPAKPLQRLFAVQNPTRDLPYADLEVCSIRSHFNGQPIVLGQDTSRTKLDQHKASLQASHCLHFSCHGYFNFGQPERSGLLLAGSALPALPAGGDPASYLPLTDGGALDLNQCLTLLDLFQLDLRQTAIVALSACETGLCSVNSPSDEVVGLSSGFLYAGCNSVIATLWTVSDLSTGLLMTEFYRLLKQQDLPGKPANVALALRQAQQWLRQLSRDQAVARIEKSIAKLPGEQRNHYRLDIARLRRDHKPDDRPYESPFHWAAFCAVGQ